MIMAKNIAGPSILIKILNKWKHIMNDLGNDKEVHGELYFKPFGGVDGFCNENKDGA